MASRNFASQIEKRWIFVVLTSDRSMG